MKFFFRKNKTIFITLMLSLLVLFFSVKLGLHKSFSRNDNTLISLFGTIFGLLLASYGIHLSNIMNLSKYSLKLKAIDRINSYFLYCLIINLVVIIILLKTYFFGIDKISFYINIFFMSSIMILLSVLILSIHYIIKKIKKDLINTGL